MVYLKDDNGVTVESAGDEVEIEATSLEGRVVIDAEDATAILRGLLRWKLETAGAQHYNNLVGDVQEQYETETGRPFRSGR